MSSRKRNKLDIDSLSVENTVPMLRSPISRARSARGKKGTIAYTHRKNMGAKNTHYVVECRSFLQLHYLLDYHAIASVSVQGTEQSKIKFRTRRPGTLVQIHLLQSITIRFGSNLFKSKSFSKSRRDLKKT